MTLSVPYSFVPGTKARASEINANFIFVLANITDLNSRFASEHESVSDALANIDAQKMKCDLSNINETGQAFFDAKVNLNLENSTPTHDFSQKLETVNIRTIIDCYNNGSSFYRIYSDGWCIQGGVLSPWTGANLATDTVNFLKTFNDTNYSLHITDATSATYSNAATTNLGSCKYYTKFTTSFSLPRPNSTYFGERNWMAIGYLAEGEY